MCILKIALGKPFRYIVPPPLNWVGTKMFVDDCLERWVKVNYYRSQLQIGWLFFQSASVLCIDKAKIEILFLRKMLHLVTNSMHKSLLNILSCLKKLTKRYENDAIKFLFPINNCVSKNKLSELLWVFWVSLNYGCLVILDRLSLFILKLKSLNEVVILLW